MIGPLNRLGDNYGWINSFEISSCPYDIAKDQWKYWGGSLPWIKVEDSNEISIECSTGNE